MNIFSKEKKLSEYEELCQRLKEVTRDLRLAEQDERLAAHEFVEVAIERTNAIRKLRSLLYKQVKAYNSDKKEMEVAV